MNRYIDAEKLVAKIEKSKNELKSLMSKFYYAANYKEWEAELSGYNKILSLIASLQQEQPKFKVGDTIHKIGENTAFPMTIKRIDDGDYVCVTEHQLSFINIKFQDDYELVEQEQPEVDLEKEIGRWMDKLDDKYCIFVEDYSIQDIKDTARHFYELGKNSE